MPAPVEPEAGGPENGQPRSELQELQFRAGQVTDEVTTLANFGLFLFNM